MNIPFFRKVVRAIGEHDRPAQTAYRYEVVEFWPSGTFKKVPDLLIKKTQMRMKDKNRWFEEQVAGEWKLIDADTFQNYEMAWVRKVLWFRILSW